jgi:hypothetical protein
MFARMVRREPQLSLDRRYETSLFTVTPEELSADGTDLLAARFDFAIDLDDPGLLLLRWGEEGFQRVDPAELPVGQAVALTDNADIWASM